MLARLASGLLRQASMMGVAAPATAAATSRALSTSGASLSEGEPAPAGVKEFTEAWQKVAPSTMNLPEFPSGHLAAETARDAAADGDLFPVNFYTPNGVIAETKVRVTAVCVWQQL